MKLDWNGDCQAPSRELAGVQAPQSFCRRKVLDKLPQIAFIVYTTRLLKRPRASSALLCIVGLGQGFRAHTPSPCTLERCHAFQRRTKIVEMTCPVPQYVLGAANGAERLGPRIREEPAQARAAWRTCHARPVCMCMPGFKWRQI